MFPDANPNSSGCFNTPSPGSFLLRLQQLLPAPGVARASRGGGQRSEGPQGCPGRPRLPPLPSSSMVLRLLGSDVCLSPSTHRLPLLSASASSRHPESRTGPLPEDHFKVLTVALKVRRDLTLLPDSLTPSAPSLVPWPLLHLPSLCLPQGLGTGSSRISSRSLLSLHPHSPPAGAQISLPKGSPQPPAHSSSPHLLISIQ